MSQILSEREGPDTLLITGGTGTLGAALLERLEAGARVEKILVLSRQPALPEGRAAGRGKVAYVRGDVTEPDLALAPATAEELAARVTGIVHAAADTRFSAPLDEAMLANVEGTRNVLAFAARCRRLDRFLHLSTAYVAGRRTGRIFEPELEHAAGFVNFYEQSKYAAERIVRARMAVLPIIVLRLSTILGDSRTGRVSRLAAIHHALRFFYRSLAPMLPGDAASRVDLIALDYAADAVAHFTGEGFPGPGRTFHIVAGDEAMPLAALLDATYEAFVRHRPAWRRRAIEMPAIVDLATFELFVRSVDEVGDATLRQSVNLIRHFAPEMAFPKVFDDSGSSRALAAAGILRPCLEEFYSRVVRRLVETEWAGETAEEAA